jgi:hypothetical protein
MFQFTEKAGLYAVGLKIVEQYDYSRSYGYSTDDLGKPYGGERARPLQTLVWYPAESSENSNPMTVADYANLWATETRFGHPRLSEKGKEWIAAMRPALTMSMWAVRDAPLIRGHFPVVVYAPSFSKPSWENADLCEYLASNGYVVIASPSLGATARQMTLNVDGIDAQARDISFLIGYAQTLANTDPTHIGVMGFSWGGIANLFAAARDARINALVALDGSMRYYPGLVRQAGDVHPEQMTIPLLFFAQREFAAEDQEWYMNNGQANSPSVLNAWTHGDLLIVHMLGLTHADFGSMLQRNEDTWWELFHVWPQWLGDYGREDAMVGYGWMARYTLAFLNTYLKQEAASRDFIRRTPAENGVPPHLMALSYRMATAEPVSFEPFRAEIGRLGFDHVAEIYDNFQKQKPDFKLDEGALSSWSDELMDDDKVHEAITLLKLGVQMYPESSGLYLSLGDAYARSGQSRLAVDCFRKSIEKDSDNGAAKKKLMDLEAQSTKPNSERRSPNTTANRSDVSCHPRCPPTRRERSSGFLGRFKQPQRLHAVMPEGICDYSRAGVGQGQS